jgi:hypothetical protein
MTTDEGIESIEPPTPITYSDPEVADIMVSLQNLYALDDAIYNQGQLNRPDTFIKPLKDMRERISGYLRHLTSKGEVEKK